MSEARSWLPPGTNFGKVDQRIEGVVREWSRAWFGDDDVVVSAGVRGAVWNAAKPQSCARGAWLVIPEESGRAMARRALHMDALGQESEADQAVLGAIGEECRAALRGALVRDLELESTTTADSAGATLALAAGAGWTIDCGRTSVRLAFVMSEAERIALLQRLLPPASPRSNLVSPGLALAPFEIELAARLGSCAITLAELRSLSPGDVLVLDRDLSASLPLTVNRAAVPGGTCTVAREADSLHLEITAPIIGRNP